MRIEFQIIAVLYLFAMFGKCEKNGPNIKEQCPSVQIPHNLQFSKYFCTTLYNRAI